MLCGFFLLCQGAASIDEHAGIGIGIRQRLIGLAGMLQLVSMRWLACQNPHLKSMLLA
jgi:hypothetical protein